MAETVDKIKVVQRHAFLGGGFLVCGVAFYDWVFAPGILAGCARSCDLALLHRRSGECAGALISAGSVTPALRR
jgi:hypothetical protein